MTELTGEIKLTGAQRLSIELGHVLGRYRLGTARRPEDIKWDLACKLHDYLDSTVVGFDSDEFMKACGYSNRKPS
mgnify:CR=1 FL=1